MAVVTSGGRSTLNPNAPLFIPAAVRQVEDFSPEWWELVTTSTWFRDYWMRQQQEQEEDIWNAVAGMLPEVGVDEEMLNMEAQYEEFLLSCGSKPADANGRMTEKETDEWVTKMW